VMLLLSAATALMVALVAAPFVPQVAHARYVWMLILVVPLAAALHPRVLGPVLDRVIGAIGGEPLERLPSGRGIAAATAWALGSWLTAGAQVWLLTGALGAELTWRTFALSVAGYAFAWAVGMLVVFAPAGAGAREVALIALLSSVVGGGGAVLVLVLASRALFTLADLVAAGVGYGVGRRRGSS
jgi:glycosyltransferase 2 family protein